MWHLQPLAHKCRHDARAQSVKYSDLQIQPGVKYASRVWGDAAQTLVHSIHPLKLSKYVKMQRT